MSGPSPSPRSYPKPEGWHGGPDGRILRTGSGSRIGINLATDKGEDYAQEDRRQELDFNHADFGGSHAGQCYPMENYDECYGDA